MRAKFEPGVYGALSNAGMSNREIARHLNVDEASVRRALKIAPPQKKRLTVYVFEG